MRVRRFILKTFFLAVLILVVFWGYLAYKVTDRFEERRWNLPSRIYSDSFPLYAGKHLSVDELETKLKHLHYHASAKIPEQPGEYRKSGNDFEIHLHSFDYPHEKFSSKKIRLTLVENRIATLKDAKNEDLPVINLEPELIASIFDQNMEDRTVVSLDQIPQNLINAVIAIEDERFYSHYGVDPMGILRAAFANLKALRVVQGGSTLTQQLVKNFFLHHGKTFNRKFNELFMAVSMELRYSKQEILEAYLNEIYFGQRGPASISGVQEAARHYFSKNVQQLSLAESAMLAGIIRSPGQYNPYRNSEAAKARRQLVLAKMKELGFITDEELSSASATSLPKTPPERNANAAHFVEFVKKQLSESFPQSILTSQGLRIFTTLDMGWQRQAESAVEKHIARLEKDFPKLKENATAGRSLQGVLLSIQPGTGFIKTYVAGRDFGKVQFDHISQAKRQPGSTFKPFVYLAALNSQSPSFTLSSILEDEPITLENDGTPWTPKNYGRNFHGKIRLRQALENSLNVATAWLGDQIGFERVVYTAEKAGIGSDLKPYPSLVLGAFEVTPMELALAYTVFPNQGARAEPVAIRRVVTPEGAVLEKKSVAFKPVFDANKMYLMNKILTGVIDNGTAASARRLGFSGIAAGKTGTTNGTKDAWFVGYTPELLSLSWVGYDDNEATGLTGATGALPIWTDFMKTATRGQTIPDFTPTQDIIIVTIDRKTGLLYNENCTAPLSEYFIEGTEPLEYCDQVLPDSVWDEMEKTEIRDDAWDDE